MKPAQLRALRLRALHITAPTLSDPAEVVAQLGALQAQDYAGALWAIGLRTRDAGLREVERAVAERRVVRSWPMRGTLHCVAAPDLHWMLDLLAPRVLARSAKRHADLDLDAALFRRAERTLLRALEGGAQLTREELRAQLARAGLDLEGPRLYHCLWYLAQNKLLCFGAPRGKQATFTLLADWVPPPRHPLPREEALARLALRYFTGHGPASLPDLARWAGIGLSEAKLGLAAALPQLETSRSSELPYYFAPPHGSPPAAASGAFLLPGFDEYLLGYADRDAVLDPEHAQAIVPGGNGVFRPTLVLHGRVAGTWRAKPSRRELRIELAPFSPLSAASRRQLARAEARYAAFLGLDA